MRNFSNFLSSPILCISLLCLQSMVVTVLICFVRVRGGPLFFPSTAVIFSELLKLSICLVVVIMKKGQLNVLKSAMEIDILQTNDILKLIVPSVLYVMQNNLVYLALTNLNPSFFMVTMNELKFISTVLFQRLLSNASVSPLKQLCLITLLIAVIVAQLQPLTYTSFNNRVTRQDPLLGFMSTVVCAMMSGFCAVSVRKFFKEEDLHNSVPSDSFWRFNLQLAFISIPVALLVTWITDSEVLLESSYLHGYDWVVWCVIILQAIGGLLVSAVTYHSPHLTDKFVATSCSTALISFIGTQFLGLKISWEFVTSGVLSTVIPLVYIYFI